MAVKEYELVLVFSPEADDERVEQSMARLTSIVEAGNGTVLKREAWGTRRLAYPISHHTEGNYWITRFQMEPVQTPELESALNVSEEVIRYLLLRV